VIEAEEGVEIVGRRHCPQLPLRYRIECLNGKRTVIIMPPQLPRRKEIAAIWAAAVGSSEAAAVVVLVAVAVAVVAVVIMRVEGQLSTHHWRRPRPTTLKNHSKKKKKMKMKETTATFRCAAR
jgi:hypothetical protein